MLFRFLLGKFHAFIMWIEPRWMFLLFVNILYCEYVLHFIIILEISCVDDI